MTPEELAKYYREEKLAGDHNPFPDRDGKRRSPVAFAAGVAWVEDGVATYKLPETIEIFDELPFTPTGKIQRHVLVRRVLERRGA